MGKTTKRYFDVEESEEEQSIPRSSMRNKKGALSTIQKTPDTKIKTVIALTTRKGHMKRKKNKGKKKVSDDLVPDEFANPPTIPKETLKKYSRGAGLTIDPSDQYIQTKIRREKIIRRDEKIKLGLDHAARAELLLLEQPGGIEVGEGETTLQLRQCDIIKQVDFASATKGFNLNLEQFAPYKLNYTLNGRQLVLGGRRGHVAAFDWITKNLMCEFNVMESVHDVRWLHNEMLFAVAQKQWTYIYDNQGIEIHCLKKLDRIISLDFLPYHFLLVGGHETGFLSWVDVSVGKIAAQFGTRGGALGILTANPANAVIHLGHMNGTVTLWSPSVKKSLASVLCHGSPVSALAVDSVGRLMATGAMDGTLRIWDLRNSFTPLSSVKIGVATSLSFSQRGLLSFSTGNRAMIFSEIGQKQKPYLRHISHGVISSTQFCPFEDILGIGTYRGFDSVIVPGSGEANFDALERNPFQTKQQRKEAEVKALLEKIQPELISMDNNLLGEVDTDTLQTNLEQKPKYIKKADINIAHRMKRKTAKVPKLKQNLQTELNLRTIREIDQEKKMEKAPFKRVRKTNPSDPLSRFIKLK